MKQRPMLFKTPWQRKRIVILWLVVLSIVVVILSHPRVTETLRSIKKCADVRRVMNSGARESGIRYQVRGPFTLAQIERELFGTPPDVNGVTETPENADPARAAWERMMKSEYRRGDEFYFVKSDEYSWAQLKGWQGYALVRQKRVVNTFTTRLN